MEHKNFKYDLTGRIFGRLTVLSRTNIRRNSSVVWNCKCICGKTMQSTTRSLNSSHTQSCGCLQRDVVSTQFTKHGARKNNLKTAPLYIIWCNMKARCYNKKNVHYAYYGGRGITICDLWLKSFIVFRDFMLALPNCPKNAMMPKAKLDLEIDRIENNKNYEPGNVRWATRTEQIENRSCAKRIRVNGVWLSLKSAVDQYAKVPYHTVYGRLAKGWTVQDSFMLPPWQKPK